MSWSSLQVGAWWPLLPLVGAGLVLAWRWRRRPGAAFPDPGLAVGTRRAGGVIDRLPILLGAALMLLLAVAMMDVSVSRVVEADKRARDFLVIVDTSRSMRENTSVARRDFPPTYQRRTGLFAGQVDDPAAIPWLARYEVARESLLRFLATRRDADRIALVYFNSMVYPMSGFTGNLEFIEQQLASMDPYVAYGTNIRWAVEEGLDMIERYPTGNRRAVILLTDAETRGTAGFGEQMDRMRELGVAFYLLWITSDADAGSPMAMRFLRVARTLGSVYTIDDMAKGYLQEALREIAELEDYPYTERRYERIDLSHYSFTAAAYLALGWALLIGTAYVPLARVAYATSGRSSRWRA